MTGRARLLPLLPEVALSGAVLASLVWTWLTFRQFGFLPQPFVFDTNDTFMDWFNTAYWAHNRGAFEVWRSIYPPLSFVVLDVFALPGCYLSSPFYARDCDWLARLTIYAFYCINVVVAWLAFRRTDGRTAPMRTLAFGLGLPLLFTLERANLILVAMPFFMIANSRIARSRFWQAISAAVAINFKPYLILVPLAHAMKRDWRKLELAGIATLALYLLTLALVGSGTPAQIVANTRDWLTFQSGKFFDEVNYSTSYAPMLLIKDLTLPVLEFVSSRTVDTIVFAGTLAIRICQAISLAALAVVWLQPKALPAHRISLLLLGLYLVTTSPGGYAQIFLLFLVMLEPWRRPGQVVALICAYLLCLVGDWQLSKIMQISVNSWLSGRGVSPVFGLTLGQFVRPGLIIVIQCVLALDSIVEVVRAHRVQRPVLGLAP
ncbi:MAG: DUF2029 domain-containing protein, partial [Sphingomonadales bacterium]|nr:DUF2029 domain-containing protein [Sphingomonadales bacterium]